MPASPNHTTFSPYLTPPEERPSPVPTWGETFDSAFALDNDVRNAWELINKPAFKPTKDYPLMNRLKEENLWELRDNFLGVSSDEELYYVRNKISKEQQYRDTYARSGWAGYVAGAAAGIFSPINLLPVVGPAARAGMVGRAVLEGAGLVGGASLLDEAILQANQPTRTATEGALSVGAGTILGGILGGAAGLLHPREFERMASDMADISDISPVSRPPVPFHNEPSDAGAASALATGVGRLKGDKYTRWLLQRLSYLGPITRGIEQGHAPKSLPNGSPIIRWMTGKFSQGGLKLEGNVAGKAASPGGNIESSIITYQGPLHFTNMDIESAYKDYIVHETGKPLPKVFARTAAKVKGYLSNDLMDFTEFKKQVSIAVAEALQHPNQYVVDAAKASAKQLQDVYEEGVHVGVYTGKEAPKGDLTYLTHLWDTVKVNANPNGLINKFTQHFNRELNAEFAPSFQKLSERLSKNAMFIKDAQRSGEEITKLTDEFKKRLDDLNDSLSFEGQQAALEAANLREKARKFVGTGSTTENAAAKRALLDEAAKAEASGGEELAKFTASKREINRRLSNLRNSKYANDQRLTSKLEKIERNERMQTDTIYRVAKQLQKLLSLLSKGSDREVEAELSRTKTLFAKTAEAFDNAEENIVKLTKDENPEIEKVLDIQDKRMNKMDDLAAHLENIEAFDREALATEVRAVSDDVLRTASEVNARRAVRNAKLEASAKRYTPEEVQARLAAKIAKQTTLPLEFKSRWQTKGGDDIDLTAGRADFSDKAADLAKYWVNKIKGTERRVAYSDIIQEKRGMELARYLNIPFKEVMDYLETDIQKILSVYTRTNAADIELKRAFGTADMSEWLVKLTDEQDNAIAAIKDMKDKKGNPLSEKAQNVLQAETNKFYDEGRKDLYVLLERARGVRGIPTDPNSWSARAAEMALKLNALRYLGGALISSISDPARTIQKHGLVRTFRDGFVPFVTNFKDMNLSTRQAQWAGTAIDMEVQTRLNTWNDVFDDAARGTKLERGIHYASQHMGNVAGFNQWTQLGKKIASGAIVARLVDSIGMVMGEKATAKELAEATEYLASVNITPDIADTIWKQITNGVGGGKSNGIWLPNTELWDIHAPGVRTARRAFRAALAGETNDTIITPGMERANWIDSGYLGRILGQFKSFSMSSTQKTVMAGLQEHDAAYLTGTLISLSLGAMSYYLYAVATGGDTYDRMIKSIDEGDWGHWADEAISRSGQTAMFDSVQRVANKIPLINQFTSFSGGPTTKRAGGGVVNELGGPSLDLLSKVAEIMTRTKTVDGVTSPTFDRRSEHIARQIIPGQNLFWFRSLLDKVENATGDVFHLEGKRQ